VHAVEKVHGYGEIENCGPYTEAEGLLLQSVVVLWPAAKGGKDPQLRERMIRGLKTLVNLVQNRSLCRFSSFDM
jgi:hypothetical protein